MTAGTLTALVPDVRIISGGYGHGDPPPGAIAVDLRTGFHDPHFDPDLRELTAADRRVAGHVLATPGISTLVTVLVAGAFEAVMTHGQPVTYAIFCTGGRHRAPAVATEVATRLAVAGVNVALTHRDIGKPVIRRGEQPSAAGSSGSADAGTAPVPAPAVPSFFCPAGQHADGPGTTGTPECAP